MRRLRSPLSLVLALLMIPSGIPAVFANPGMTLRPGHTVCHAAIGKGLAIEPAGKTRFMDFLDGTTNTLLVMEGNVASQVPWTSPDYQRLDAGDPLQHFRGARPGGFHALFSDAAVKFIADTIDPAVFRGLLTRGGGERVLMP